MLKPNEQSFSDSGEGCPAFSNADVYMRSHPNVSELRHQYFDQIRLTANFGELERSAWHARDPGFKSPYLRSRARAGLILGLIFLQHYETRPTRDNAIP